MAAKMALGSGALLAIWALQATGQTLPVAIPIVVYDNGKAGAKAVSDAEDLTGKILLTAGVKTQWQGGSLAELPRLQTDFSRKTPAECRNSSPDMLRVEIIALAPAGLPAQALGFSLPCASAGIQVVVYADRIAQVSQANAPAFYRVLAYAMAHELGHVLLHSDSHDNTGLMKGIWLRSDWQRAAVSIVPFSRSESRQILAAIQNPKITQMAWLAPVAER